MHRTQIYIDHVQRRLLRELAKERKASLSELIREAISNLIAQYRKPKGLPLQGIIGLYRDDSDKEGSTGHDDIYE